MLFAVHSSTSEENLFILESFKLATLLPFLFPFQGIEDYFGDMDFKVACSNYGVTAAQLDMKIPGLQPRILFEAFLLASQGNNYIRNVMKSCLSGPRYGGVTCFPSKIRPKLTSPVNLRDWIFPSLVL